MDSFPPNCFFFIIQEIFFGIKAAKRHGKNRAFLKEEI